MGTKSSKSPGREGFHLLSPEKTAAVWRDARDSRKEVHAENPGPQRITDSNIRTPKQKIK